MTFSRSRAPAIATLVLALGCDPGGPATDWSSDEAPTTAGAWQQAEALAAHPGTDKGAAPPPDARFETITAAGSGCRGPTTYQIDLNRQGTAFIISFYDFVVDARPTDRLQNAVKDCTVSAEVRVPAGYSYALSGLALEGASALSPGMTSSVTLSHGFVGSGLLDSSVITESVPPAAGAGPGPTWRISWELAQSPAAWSPCGQSAAFLVSVDLDVRNSPHKQSGVSSVAYLFGDITRIRWRRCP